MCNSCGSNSSNCGSSNNSGCAPKDYTSCIVYDGLKFTCPDLAGLKPNCANLNNVLELFGAQICGLLSGRKVLNIGAWDMDTNSGLNVPHGLSATEFASITEISALITNDAGTLKTPIGMSSGTSSSGSLGIDATNIILSRVTAEFFDSASYSGAVSSRGVIVINYTKD